MKRTLLITLSIILAGIALASVDKPALAVVSPLTHAEWCDQQNWELPPDYKIGVWDAKTQICYKKYVVGSGTTLNACFPEYDLYVANGFDPSGAPLFVVSGCGLLPDWLIPPPKNIKTDDPLSGSEEIKGGEFSWDYDTCKGLCKVITSGLTSGAKAALGDLPGKVLAKAYVTIKDADGELTTGPFKLCFKVKKAKNPAYYRFVDGAWVYYGGYPVGSKYCMHGTMSGNYVLVDVKP